MQSRVMGLFLRFLPRRSSLTVKVFDEFSVNFYTRCEVDVRFHSFVCGYPVVLALC